MTFKLSQKGKKQTGKEPGEQSSRQRGRERKGSVEGRNLAWPGADRRLEAGVQGGWGRSCEAFQVMDENMNLKCSIGTSKGSKWFKRVDLTYVCKKKKNHFSCCMRSGLQERAGSVAIPCGK